MRSQSRGLCRLLAVTISVDHELAAPFVDAVNTFYERGDIPIGVVGKGGVIEKSAFLSLVEEQDSGRFRYPHELLPDQPVQRCDGPPPCDPGGPARSLGRDRPGWFLDQPGPAARFARGRISPLTGRELVERKVKVLSLMAGAFRADRGKRATTSNTMSSKTSPAPASSRTMADTDGLQWFRDRDRPALPGREHRA